MTNIGAKKLVTGKTVRQHLIQSARSQYRRIMADVAAGTVDEIAARYPEHMAIEAVVDGAREGTIGGLCREYFLSCTDAALESMYREIKKSY